MAVLLRCSACSANVSVFANRNLWNGLPVLMENWAFVICQSKTNISLRRNFSRLIPSVNKTIIRNSSAACIFVEKSNWHKNVTPLWRSLCGIESDETERQLDDCHGGIQFRNIVYEHFNFVEQDLFTKDLAKRLLEYEKLVVGQYLTKCSPHYYIRTQKLLSPDDRNFADLISTSEFKSLLDYIHIHIDKFNPNDLTSVCCSLSLLGVERDHPVMANIIMKIQEPGVELNLVSLGKIKEQFSHNLNPGLPIATVINPKLHYLLKEGGGFMMGEDDRENLRYLKSLIYDQKIYKPKVRDMLLHKVLQIITSGDVLENPICIVDCLDILNIYLKQRYIKDENAVNEVLSQCMRSVLQTIENMNINILCEVCIAMVKLFGNKRWTFSHFKSMPSKQILERVKEILVQKESLSCIELRWVLPCAVYVANICDIEVWNRLRFALEQNIDNFTISDIRVIRLLNNRTFLPDYVWQHVSSVTALITVNIFKQVNPKLYADVFEDASVLRRQCEMIAKRTKCDPFALLRYIFNVSVRPADTYCCDNREFTYIVTALIQFSVLTEGLPEQFYQKLLRIIPTLKTKDLLMVMKAFDSLVYHFTENRLFQEQLFQIQVAIYENLMEKIDSARNIVEMFEIAGNIGETNHLQMQRFTAFDRLLEKTEEMCSRNFTYSIFHHVLIMLCFKFSKIYRPKLLEILINFCLDNHPVVEVMDYWLLLDTLKYSSLKVNRQEEFCDLMMTFTDEVFDSLSVSQQIRMLTILAKLQIFPIDYLKKVFSFDYLQNLDICLSQNDNLSSELKLNVMELNRCVVLECPELNQTWFLGSTGPAYPSGVVSNAHTRCQMCLEDILGGEKFVCPDVQTHYRYIIDFECLLSPDNTPVSYPDLKEKPHLNNYIQRVAVNFLSRRYYHLHSRKLLCLYLTKRRHLELLGYKVVEIPYFEWNSMALSKEENAKEYLKEKIFG